MVKLLNDWAHVSRKFTQGEYAKLLHDRKENDSKIKVRAPSERCAAHPVAAQLAPSQETMYDMREAPSNTAFSAVRGAAAAVWRGIGESDFLGSFSKMYLEGEWASWHVGAAPAGVAFSGQQAVEATHAADKSCIGKDKLKAAPSVFLNDTLPIILTKAADTFMIPGARKRHGSSPPLWLTHWLNLRPDEGATTRRSGPYLGSS
jgi:hypothetical protein